MKKSITGHTFFAFVLLVLASCGPGQNIVHTTRLAAPNSLRFIGQYEIPYNLSYNNTVVGGLSGIDYDSLNECYYLICDDRSAINPARFYTAKISLTGAGIDSVNFTAVSFLQQPGGGNYPSFKTDQFKAPDPEALRFYAPLQQLTWCNEGERILKVSDTILQNPSIQMITGTGEYLSGFVLPENVLPRSIEKGPRQNGVFEGLTFADNFNSLYVSVEEPLYEDGPRAGLAENTAFTRILKFDMKSRNQTAQYAYRLSPVARPEVPVGSFKINGISDILDAGEERLLVVERSFSTGSTHCTIRIFVVSLAEATDVKDFASLAVGGFKEAPKKLLMNLDTLGIYIDNIEGVCYGPRLANGHRTLLFVSDNNFNPLEKSQLLLFEIAE